MYKNLEKHIQINFDCEGYHEEPIMRYKLMDEKTKDILTDKIEIIRIDVPYFVEKCYNEDVKELDYKDRFIGLIGAEDIKLAKSITAGDESMEAIMKKMEDFSVNEEILGAYDAEEHRQFLEESIREQCIEQGIEQGILNTAKNMKIERVDIDFISKVTGLSKEKIEEL